MKKYFLLLLLTGAAFNGRAATITLLAPGHVTGAFDVTVQTTSVFSAPHDAGDGLLAYGFDISFDPSSLSYLGETAGSFFDDVSDNPGFGADVGGTADAGFLEDGDFTEPLTLAILHFNAIGAGPAAISIAADSSNPDQGLVYLSSSDSFSASTSVDVDVVPEPGTILLGCLAAGLIAGRIRLRRTLLRRVRS